MDLFQKGQEIQAKGFYGEGIITNPNLGENILEVDFKGKKRPVDKDEVTSIDRIPRKRPVYYQPRLTEDEYLEHGINTYDVYRHIENAKEDFPDHIIDQFRGSEIMNHNYIDDEDGRSRTYYVDVPNPDLVEGADDFTNVYTCFDREEAILFARLNYNADENGRISLISG